MGQDMHAFHRAAALALPALAVVLASCGVPDSMHVTRGISPNNIDKDVRFRTTYYFRAFDLCWNRSAAAIAAGAPSSADEYSRVIPETDSIYRFRMTGKASALFNKIKFESGTLDKTKIDPFGADVVYNSDINGYLVRDQTEARRQADAAADARGDKVKRADALDRYEALRSRLSQLNPGDPGYAELNVAMGKALAVYAGDPATVPASVETAIGGLRTDLATLTGRVDAIATPPAPDALAQRVAALEAQVKAGALPPAQRCVVDGGEIRKGFQLMGPEGMRPFDQNDRLVMAMTSSARPLVETLQEFSSRVLAPRNDPAAQLLPLSRETLKIVDARRAVDRTALDAATGTPRTVKDIFTAAITAFEGK